MKKTKRTTVKALREAATRSSKMEGLSWNSAKKNSAVIKKLKEYGRAFSV